MKIKIYPSLLNKIDLLSNDYDIEVGGYLTGEIRDGVIVLKDLLIPEQMISIGSVEINSSGQVELFRKYGSKKCREIIGHWHSHHRLGCFWSGLDKVNMNNIMGYKDLYVFVVSSRKNHLIKICIKKPINAEFENVDYELQSFTLELLKKKVDNIIKKNERSIEYE